jgi:predicted GH43/DUF377 family glycosyl hydrolase
MKTLQFNPPRREAGFHAPGYWIWCPSIIKGDDGLYHLFFMRMPNTIPFHPGWATSSEIVHATSKTAEGPYEFADVALSRRGAEYWDGRAAVNVRVSKCGDTYVMFYTGTTHPFEDVQPGEALPLDDPRWVYARAHKRIGVATAKSLSGPWTRRDAPVLPVTPGTYHSYLTSNAAPIVHADGSAYLMFKSRGHVDGKCGPMVIGVARARHYLGPYEVEPEPIFQATERNMIEDPFVWFEDGKYWMIAKDMSGVYCGEGYAPLIVSSSDGIHWDMQEARKFFSRDITWSDGSAQRIGNLDRPALLIEDGKPTLACFAASKHHFGEDRPDHEIWILTVPIES